MGVAGRVSLGTSSAPRHRLHPHCLTAIVIPYLYESHILSSHPTPTLLPMLEAVNVLVSHINFHIDVPLLPHGIANTLLKRKKES